MRRSPHLFAVSLMICMFIVAMLYGYTNAQANAISISTPYYGNEAITSYFDHRYPTYDYWPNTTYANVVRYDGLDTPSCAWICYDGHNGIDFGMGYEMVLAVADGTVTAAEWDVPGCHGPPDPRFGCGYGLYIDIAHANGYTTRYGHLSSIAVDVGDSVGRGQVIGSSGNTGNSTGAHLHFGVYLNGTAVDPFGWSGAGIDPWEQHSGVASEWLWDYGEWAGTPLPDPQYTTSRLVDDEDFDEFSAGCDAGNGFSSCTYWYEQTGLGNFNDMWWTGTISAPESDYWAKWSPNIPSSGIYDVEVYVPYNYATTWQADFRVRGADNILHHTIVDQYGVNPGRWLSLGTHYFATGGSSLQSVWVDDNTGEALSTGRKLGIDAVRFQRKETWHIYLPTIIR